MIVWFQAFVVAGRLDLEQALDRVGLRHELGQRVGEVDHLLDADRFLRRLGAEAQADAATALLAEEAADHLAALG